ncbi:MAG TPA: LysM domain-containing protein [Myxococcaceae bacterium]|nr:LysM domain-containing protein [Myxococcaceae bacterium]
MRTPLIAALTWLLAAPALAQQRSPAPPAEAEDESQEAQDDQDAADDAAADVVPDQGDRVRLRAPDGSSAPAEVHTVVRGDTLWDLSQHYLGSPWYWPKVWSYNPEIANPHWIYPGNRIRFMAAGEEVPARVEVAETEATAPDRVEGEGESGVRATGKIGYTPPTTQQRLLLQGFVTAHEVDEAGRIAGSFSEALMLSYPDNLYIRFRDRAKVRPGAEYVIFKTVKRVDHPLTGRTAGYLTHFLGKAKVVSIGKEIVTAQITATWDEINRGDLIGPANEDLRIQVAPRANQKAMNGVIVEMMVPYLTLAGEHQLVVVDRGSGDGVQIGNTFTVVRHQDLGGTLMDPKGGQDDRWPEESIAACMVVDLKEHVSTCLMTRSIREAVRGDRVVMKVEPEKRASLSVR